MPKRSPVIVIILIVIFSIAACSPIPEITSGSATHTRAANTPTSAPLTETATFPPIITSTPTITFTPTITPTPSQTSPPSQTPTITKTPTNTLTPTKVVLRAKVNIERLSCRFGPGVMYLFKYSVFKGNTLEVIGRMEGSSWILVQGSRGKNPCWVNGKMMEVRGDVLTVEAVDPHKVLAWSQYYDALTGVVSWREGNQVTAAWDQLILRAGDSSEQVPYVFEAWVCQGGEFVFAPVGSYATTATVTDEPGCSQQSYGRVLAAEKHGYTKWIEVYWPPHE